MRTSLLAALLCCGGCLGEGNIHPSEDIETDEIFPGIEAKPGGAGTVELEVRLSLEGDRHAEWIVLSDGDRLEASYQGHTKPLALDNTFALATMGSWEEGEGMTVSLLRNGHQSAPSSTLSLPLPFELLSPLHSASYSRSNDDIVVEWTPAGTDDDIILDFGGNCTAQLGSIHGLTVPDTGSYTIVAGTLVDPQKGGTCELWAEVSRRRQGSLDPAFPGGHIYAEWYERVMPTSTP